MPEPTCKPYEKHGQLTAQSDLPETVYAFPNQRKEPLTDAPHVRNAVARFDQVIDVSDADRTLALANIEEAANYLPVSNFWESMASMTNFSFAHLSFVSDCVRTVQGDEI
jgi:hypothetical protein